MRGAWLVAGLYDGRLRGREAVMPEDLNKADGPPVAAEITGGDGSDCRRYGSLRGHDGPWEMACVPISAMAPTAYERTWKRAGRVSPRRGKTVARAPGFVHLVTIIQFSK